MMTHVILAEEPAFWNSTVTHEMTSQNAMADIKAVFMGTPAFAVPALNALIEMGCATVGVYTQPDRPKGRSRTPEPSPVKVRAMELGLDVFQPESLRSPAAVEEIKALNPDVIVVAAYGKFLPSDVLSVPPHGCVNIHPSLLPMYRGPSPVAAALLDGQAETGVSLMLLDEGMDTGPIIAVEKAPIAPRDTADALTAQLFDLGARMLRNRLPEWVAGEITPVPQSGSEATTTRLLKREDGQADWNVTAVELDRKLRAFTPWPGLYTQWEGKTLKIITAVAVDLVAQGPPGLVTTLDNGMGLGVASGGGMLAVEILQLEGRRAQSAKEFLAGYPEFPGSLLPS